MELAENLKKLRKAAGLTQEALAETLQPPGRSSPRSQGSRKPGERFHGRKERETVGTDRQYEAMLSAAREKLAGRVPAQIAKARSLRYDPASGTLRFSSFGQDLALGTDDWDMEPAGDTWLHLLLLQALAAEETPRRGEGWKSLSELGEGAGARSAGFLREQGELLARLGRSGPGSIRRAAAALGAVFPEPGREDLAARFSFLPGYPLLMKLWYADEEFPASGTVLLGEAFVGLGLEAAGTLISWLLTRLCREAEGG